MKDIIRISWDSGYYALILEKFFPTTMEKTRKIFKLMLADPAWGDAEIKELLQYFQERRDRAVKSAAENRAMSKATMELSQRVFFNAETGMTRSTKSTWPIVIKRKSLNEKPSTVCRKPGTSTLPNLSFLTW